MNKNLLFTNTYSNNKTSVIKDKIYYLQSHTQTIKSFVVMNKNLKYTFEQ